METEGEKTTESMPSHMSLAEKLHAHENASQHRFEKLHKCLKHIKEHKMSDTVIENKFVKDPMSGFLPMMMGNNQGAGVAGALGGGLGAGLLGGILGGALLGGRRGGLFGGGGGEGEGGGETRLQDTIFNTGVLTKLGAIEASIPFNEAQVQLALANSTAQILAQGNTNQAANSLANNLTNQNICDATASIIAAEGAVKDSVANWGAVNLTATKDAQFATTLAVANSTKEILAVLTNQNIENLQRQLTVAESRGVEDRLGARSDRSVVEVTQTVNQNNAQLQAQSQSQQQQQQIVVLLSQLCSGMGNLTQIAHATNSNIIAGNTGAVATGTQTASPVNVKG